MDVRHMRYFLEIVERGSITGAAQSLNVAQPALSLHVKNMEEQLGTRLLVRSRSGTVPTQLARNIFIEGNAKVHVAYNSLAGYMPTQLGLLTNVRRLGGVNNALSGTLPTELARLTLLAHCSPTHFAPRGWFCSKAFTARSTDAAANAAVAEAIRSAPSAASREADLTRAARKALHGPLMRVRAGEAVLAEDASNDVRAAVAEALATTV